MRDLITATKVAYNLDHKGYKGHKTEELFKSLDYEIPLLARLKNKYDPKIDSEMTHPISIARALVMNHRTERLSSWKDGIRLQTNACCILDFPKFRRTNEYADDEPIMTNLILYIDSTLRYERFSDQTRLLIKDLFTSMLSIESLETAYSWLSIKTASIRREAKEKQKRIDKQRKQTSTDENQKQVFKPAIGIAADHTCPAMPEQIEEMLRNKLNEAINEVIQTNENIKINIPKGFTTETYFKKLINEFIRHNKGWKNPTSLSNISNFTKIENNCPFRTATIDVPKALILLRNMIEKLKK